MKKIQPSISPFRCPSCEDSRHRRTHSGLECVGCGAQFSNNDFKSGIYGFYSGLASTIHEYDLLSDSKVIAFLMDRLEELEDEKCIQEGGRVEYDLPESNDDELPDPVAAIKALQDENTSLLEQLATLTEQAVYRDDEIAELQAQKQELLEFAHKLKQLAVSRGKKVQHMYALYLDAMTTLNEIRKSIGVYTLTPKEWGGVDTDIEVDDIPDCYAEYHQAQSQKAQDVEEPNNPTDESQGISPKESLPNCVTDEPASDEVVDDEPVSEPDKTIGTNPLHPDETKNLDCAYGFYPRIWDGTWDWLKAHDNSRVSYRFKSLKEVQEDRESGNIPTTLDPRCADKRLEVVNSNTIELSGGKYMYIEIDGKYYLVGGATSLSMYKIEKEVEEGDATCVSILQVRKGCPLVIRPTTATPEPPKESVHPEIDDELTLLTLRFERTNSPVDIAAQIRRYRGHFIVVESNQSIRSGVVHHSQVSNSTVYLIEKDFNNSRIIASVEMDHGNVVHVYKAGVRPPSWRTQ